MRLIKLPKNIKKTEKNPNFPKKTQFFTKKPLIADNKPQCIIKQQITPIITDIIFPDT